MALAEQALGTAHVNFETGHFRATVNCAYYATFFAASAILLTRELERRRHSGVISGFREHFVKPGLVEVKYSSFYGEAMVIREDADYAVEIPIDLDTAEMALNQARRFVGRMHEYLVEQGFWNEQPE